MMCDDGKTKLTVYPCTRVEVIPKPWTLSWCSYFRSQRGLVGLRLGASLELWSYISCILDAVSHTGSGGSCNTFYVVQYQQVYFVCMFVHIIWQVLDRISVQSKSMSYSLSALMWYERYTQEKKKKRSLLSKGPCNHFSGLVPCVHLLTKS